MRATRKARRIAKRAAQISAVGIIALMGVGIGQAASTPSASATAAHATHLSPVQRLRGACVLGETFGIDHHTYRCVPANAPKHHTCRYSATATVQCVHRAPRLVCHEALGNTVNRCWWFTGSDTQIIFDWKGIVETS